MAFRARGHLGSPRPGRIARRASPLVVALVGLTPPGQARPPRYPPGFSAALAPFALVGTYPANVQLGSKLYATLYLVATLAAGWIVGGPLAAAVGVALVGSSP